MVENLESEGKSSDITSLGISKNSMVLKALSMHTTYARKNLKTGLQMQLSFVVRTKWRRQRFQIYQF